jgi:hypothetical protein
MIHVRRFRIGALAVAVAVVAASARIQAHEPGSTRVDIEIAADGRVAIAVPVDPLALWRQQELDDGRVPAPDPSPASLRTQRDALADAVREAIDLSVDGTPLTLKVVASEWVDRPGTGQGNVLAPSMLVTLQGRVRAGAGTMAWRYGLPVGTYPLRVQQPGVAPRVLWVVGASRTLPLTLVPMGTRALVGQYVRLGLVHIVPRGLDHILFVLSLFLLAPRWRPLLTQVSAFTAAHTVTLGATMIGWIRLPSATVEPLIAISIAWVALENVWRPTMSRTRLVVVFLFGLLHGAGFAGVLTELGLPTGARLLALLAFNVGVEAGQALVLLAAFACTAALARHPRAYRAWVVVPASLVIALAGLYWTVERVLSLHAG